MNKHQYRLCWSIDQQLKHSIAYAFYMDKQCMQNRERIGANIKRIRESQGISLRVLAHMTNMDYANICAIENGAANFKIDTLSKIASGLDIDVSRLFEPSAEIDYAYSKNNYM